MSTYTESQMLIARSKYRAKLIAVCGFGTAFAMMVAATIAVAYSPASEISIIFALLSLIPLGALINSWMTEQGTSDLAKLRNKYVASIS